MSSAPPIVSTNNETCDHARQRATSAPAWAAPNFRRRKADARLLPGVAGIVRRALESTDYDPSFERPDQIEDDYYRLRHQPRD